jgi:predicted transcriptional regulator
MSDRATVTFHTSPETKARLDRLASLTRRSKSFLTNEAVERYLAEEEAFVTAVETGLAQAEAGQVVPHAEAAEYLRSVVAGTPRTEPKPGRA